MEKEYGFQLSSEEEERRQQKRRGPGGIGVRVEQGKAFRLLHTSIQAGISILAVCPRRWTFAAKSLVG